LPIPGTAQLARPGIEIYRLKAARQAQRDAEDHVADAPSLRISDADREAAAAQLREHYAQGRLTLEEFNQRLDQAFAATTQGQLRALTRDLPPAAPRPPLPSAGAGRERGRRDRRAGSRARLGAIPAIVAALVAALVVFGLHLPMFLWPGKLAILLMIFAAVRWLVRVLWGLGRGGWYRSGR
jgi:Domain of unknown function (DUF1707)